MIEILRYLFIAILIFDLTITSLAKFKYRTLDTVRYCGYNIIVIFILYSLIKGVV